MNNNEVATTKERTTGRQLARETTQAALQEVSGGALPDYTQTGSPASDCN